jgi:polyisoprenyl-teichoic acid--peptidoglycan teichoic acid transferase
VLKYILLFCAFFLSSCSQFPQYDTDKKNNDSVTHKENKTINFLILGSDTRDMEKVSRSDSIMIVQYNPKHENIKLVSIMRDSYVEIPGYTKKYNKINLAYFLGGKELLKETLKKNFDISIDHTINVDFQAFIKIIDLTVPEGIKVNVKQKMIDDMHLNLHAGENILHGKELLSYVRFRHDGESDFGRVRRQQEIIIALQDKLQKKLTSFDGLAKMPELVEESLKYVSSDIPLKDMLAISSKIILNPIGKVDTLRIPVNEEYEIKKFPHSGEVLFLDIQKNKQVLKEFLNEPQPVNN